MPDLVDSDAVIPSEDILVRLLQMGVVIEEYAEEKSARILGMSADDELTSEILADSKDESKEHRDKLVSLIEGVSDSDVDKREVERLVRDAVERTVSEPAGSDEALRQQLKSERLAYEFYDSLIEACRKSEGYIDMSPEELERVVSQIEEIRDDEREDAEKLESMLQANGNGAMDVDIDTEKETQGVN
ncbi:MAG: hypothetical protein SXQ77_10985 [Halobacteria archaeon]|nr:hypothetical protein [Halobacteria archaeon]